MMYDFTPVLLVLLFRYSAEFEVSPSKLKGSTVFFLFHAIDKARLSQGSKEHLAQHYQECRFKHLVSSFQALSLKQPPSAKQLFQTWARRMLAAGLKIQEFGAISEYHQSILSKIASIVPDFPEDTEKLVCGVNGCTRHILNNAKNVSEHFRNVHCEIECVVCEGNFYGVLQLKKHQLKCNPSHEIVIVL